jgi:DNA-binding transcriptional MerR regulator
MTHMSQIESDCLTLGKASQLLGVHPTTLRAWVDAGLVRAFLTLDGHRRFQLTELCVFLNRRCDNAETRALTTVPDRTLQQVRRHLGEQPVARESWYQRLSVGQRDQQRETGARLLGLLLQFVSHTENAEHFLTEGRALVQEYGREFALANFSVCELAQAFLFFRRMIVNAAYYPEGGVAPNDAEGARLLQRIMLFMDELLVATLEAYERATPSIVASHELLPSSNRKTAARVKPRCTKK